MDDRAFFRATAEQYLRSLFEIGRAPFHRETLRATVGEARVLMELRRKPEGMSAGSLSRDLHIGTGGIANILNALEGKGLIERSPAPNDRRSVIARITQAGIDMDERNREQVIGNIEALLTELGREDTEEMIRIMTKVIGILGRRFADQTGCVCGAKTDTRES